MVKGEKVIRTRVVNGLPFPNLAWFNSDYLLETMAHVPKDEDIIIASYPKTGTTWLQYIVLQIISKGKKFPSFNDSLTKVVPQLEMVGTAPIENSNGLRIYKHHCPYNMVQKNLKAKILYIYRNPEDTLVSFYHFVQSIWKNTLDFDEFFEEFVTGNDIEYGRYFEHVLSFLGRNTGGNILPISYEKLSANRKEEILRIAKFLGEEYFQNLSNDESLLNMIIEHTSFDYMKKNLSYERPDSDGGSSKESGSKIKHFRKGIVGDGKNSLSPDQLKRLRAVMLETMAGTKILEEWTEI